MGDLVTGGHHKDIALGPANLTMRGVTVPVTPADSAEYEAARHELVACIAYHLMSRRKTFV